MSRERRARRRGGSSWISDRVGLPNLNRPIEVTGLTSGTPWIGLRRYETQVPLMSVAVIIVDVTDAIGPREVPDAVR